MKKHKKNTRGGARSGAGRKPITDKKIPVTVYIRESTIKDVGGMDAARELAINAIEK